MRPVCPDKDEGDPTVQKVSNDSLSINGHNFTFDFVVDQWRVNCVLRDTPGRAPSPGSYLSQGFSRDGVGTSRVRLLPTGTGDMALKPPFFFPHYCFGVPGPEVSSSVPWPLIVSSPPRSSLPVGIGGWQYRRLNLATPTPGDAHTWQRLHLATPKAVNSDFPLWSPPWWVSPYV